MSVTLHVIILGSMATTVAWVAVTVAVLAGYSIAYMRERAGELDRLLSDESGAR